MFQFLFKYPSTVFIKGRFVLLSAWPAWLLPVFIVVAAGGLCIAHSLADCAMPRPTSRLARHGHLGECNRRSSRSSCFFSGSRPF